MAREVMMVKNKRQIVTECVHLGVGFPIARSASHASEIARLALSVAESVPGNMFIQAQRCSRDISK
jgi:hypothetical protein